MQQNAEKRNKTGSICLLCGCARDGSEICHEHFPRNLKIVVASPPRILYGAFSGKDHLDKPGGPT